MSGRSPDELAREVWLGAREGLTREGQDALAELQALLADAEKALWDAPCECDEAPDAHLSDCYIARYFARRAAFDAAGGAEEGDPYGYRRARGVLRRDAAGGAGG